MCSSEFRARRGYSLCAASDGDGHLISCQAQLRYQRVTDGWWGRMFGLRLGSQLLACAILRTEWGGLRDGEGRIEQSFLWWITQKVAQCAPLTQRQDLLGDSKQNEGKFRPTVRFEDSDEKAMVLAMVFHLPPRETQSAICGAICATHVQPCGGLNVEDRSREQDLGIYADLGLTCRLDSLCAAPGAGDARCSNRRGRRTWRDDALHGIPGSTLPRSANVLPQPIRRSAMTSSCAPRPIDTESARAQLHRESSSHGVMCKTTYPVARLARSCALLWRAARES